MYNICDLFFNVSELLCLYFLLLVHFAACNNHLKITLSVTFRSLTLIAFLKDFCDNVYFEKNLRTLNQYVCKKC